MMRIIWAALIGVALLTLPLGVAGQVEIVSPRTGTIVAGPTVEICWLSQAGPIVWGLGVWSDSKFETVLDTTARRVSLQFAAGPHTVVVGQLVHDGKSGPVAADTVNFFVSASTAVVGAENPTIAPSVFALEQNYPNPFNPSTTISFILPARGQVKLSVYDLRGREVATLMSGVLSAGKHEVVWQPDPSLSSGVYFARLQTDQLRLVRGMLLVR